MDDNLSILLKTVLDKAGAMKGLKEIQKLTDQQMIDLQVKLNMNSQEMQKDLKGFSQKLSKELKDSMNINVGEKDIFKFVKSSMTSASKQANKLASDLSRLNKADSMQKWANDNTKAMKKYGTQINEMIAKMGNLDKSMTTVESDNISKQWKSMTLEVDKAGKGGLTVIDKFKKAWSKFGGWTIASGSLMKGLQEVKNGVSFIRDLDDALTDIVYTTDITKSKLIDLGNSSVDMAKDLNTSVTNVLEAVKIYSTAHSSADDILRKSKSAIMLSNVSGMSGAESAKTINTAINQFELKDTSKNLNDIVDTLEYVSSQLNYDFTDGMKEISEAIEASGNVAKNAGLNMQEYSAMVGTAVEKTGQNDCPCI
jgi:hypothetical protein